MKSSKLIRGQSKPRSPVIGFEALKQPLTSKSPVQEPSEKVTELNRRLAFIKTEHQEILKMLHSEIEELKTKVGVKDR